MIRATSQRLSSRVTPSLGWKKHNSGSSSHLVDHLCSSCTESNHQRRQQQQKQQQSALHTLARRNIGWSRSKDEENDHLPSSPQGYRPHSLLLSPTSAPVPQLFTPFQGRQIAFYHSTAANDRAAAIMLGFGCLAAVSFAGAQGVKAYNEWKSSMPPPGQEEAEEASKTDDSQEAEFQAKSEDANSNQHSTQQQQEQSKDQEKGPRENVFKEWFGVGVGAKYYEGGFEDTMTRREAALILGVRESSSGERIRQAHRKLLILNHPDTGGSTYISGKINEAKELLIKGK